MKVDLIKEEQASKLRGSYIEFCIFFYKHVTDNDFIVSRPMGRESHHITLAKVFTSLLRDLKPARGELINMPPGYGKSVQTALFVAWCFTHYADCNFLYISYSYSLAETHTAFIKQIMTSRMYKYLFNVQIAQDSKAKGKFATTAGGVVAAFGSSGAVTGTNAGLPGKNRFTGAVIIDDAHKPDEAHSDTMRARVIRNYEETISQRPRDDNVPIIFIGQRLHEDDLAAFFMSGRDVRTWGQTILKGLDSAGNALYPEVQSLEYLLAMKDKKPYVFSSQIQQEPVPAGGALFKKDWFVGLDMEPDITTTFITADTAETTKSWNDATVFSFWGAYDIVEFGKKTGITGLHWLDTIEIRVEPKDLEQEFFDFYQNCMRHDVPPQFAAIEKKSTGVTLVSTLSKIRTLNIRNIERNCTSGSKTQRFLSIQPYIASKLISYTTNAIHINKCLEHMCKITATDSHRFDDICDTVSDAIHIALIDKTIISTNIKQDLEDDRLKSDAINASIIRNGISVL